jgi:hypothetical protein
MSVQQRWILSGVIGGLLLLLFPHSSLAPRVPVANGISFLIPGVRRIRQLSVTNGSGTNLILIPPVLKPFWQNARKTRRLSEAKKERWMWFCCCLN